ncbi:MAG: hypothetical protein R2867_41635 [Caldilineaceae bacterium]
MNLLVYIEFTQPRYAWCSEFLSAPAERGAFYGESSMVAGRAERRRTARAVHSENAEGTFSLTTVKWGRLFGYLRPYWRRMTLAIVALLMATGLGWPFLR